MKLQKPILFILCMIGSYAVYAGNHIVPKPVRKDVHPGGQFINHSDWNFVENKGQLVDENSTPYPPEKSGQARQRGTASNNIVRYYGHQGGVYLYCQPGKISFVFTKVENKENAVSEATGMSFSDVGVQNPEPLHRKTSFDRDHSPLSALHSSSSTSRADLVLLNSNPSAQIIASNQQEYYENFYTTDNADSGITNVHTYKTITYKSIYPNIDLVLHSKLKGLKYEFVVYPGGNVKDIQMQWNGLEGIKKLSEGMPLAKGSGIEYSCSLGKMIESKPVSFQGENSIISDFVKTNSRIAFNVGRYDKTKTLVIDPYLVWGTYFGGSGITGEGPANTATGVACDDKGSVYMIGTTMSGSDIATSGAYQTSFVASGEKNAFLTKFDSAGNMKWSTYFGGSGYAMGTGVSTDITGNVYISGMTETNSGLATKGAFQTSYSGGGSTGGGDAFLAKFKNDGKILWATYYGGPSDDFGFGVATDVNKNVYLVGGTASNSGIATKGSSQSSYTNLSGDEAFIAKFDSSGSRLWGTYFGVNETDAFAVTCTRSGDVYITGATEGPGLATNGAYQTSFEGGSDGFLSKFSSEGSLQWATYFGGSEFDQAVGITADTSGNVFITGSTTSNSGIATSGGFESSFTGMWEFNYKSHEGFLAKFSTNGVIQWATYCENQNNSEYPASAVAIDRSGNVYITGRALIPGTGGSYKAYISEFASSGSHLWEKYFGGTAMNDISNGQGISIDNIGNIYLTGVTSSDSDIATIGAYQYNNNASNRDDAFLIKLGPIDAGIDSILKPRVNGCADSQTAVVQLHNFGYNQFENVIINWSVNGKIQPGYYWTGSLLPDSSAIVNIGRFLPVVGKCTIKSWTSLPDGLPDANPNNDTSTNIIQIIPPPVVHPGANRKICPKDTVSIGDTGIFGHSYSWSSNPAGFSSTISNPTVSPSVTTIYYLTETVQPTGCSNTDSVTVTLKPLPLAITGSGKVICVGDSVRIGGILIQRIIYNWTSNPTGFSSTNSYAVVAPVSTTSYSLTVHDTVTGCKNSNSVEIIVNPLPVANVGQTSYQVCQGGHIKIGANGAAGIVYSWTSAPAGFTSSLPDPVVNPVNNTVYNLVVKDTITGCSNKSSSKILVSINQAPVANAGTNQTICAGDSVPIGTHGIAGNKYIWTSNPTGYHSGSPIPIVKPDTTTSYLLTVTNSAGCIDIDSVTIKVNPRPFPIAGKAQNICEGTVIQLGESSKPGHTYSWSSNPSGFSSSISDPIDSPKVTTTYYLKETISATGCPGIDSVLISVAPRPDIQFDVKNINGYEYGFTVKKPNEWYWQYHWTFGDSASGKSDTASGFDVSHTYSQNGKYKVNLVVSLPGFCTETNTYLVDINEKFGLNIFPNPFETQTDINYTLVDPGHLRISVVDEVGKQLGVLVDKQLNRGEYNTYFDAAFWKTRPAMYFVIFQLDDKVIVKKIIQLGSIYH